MALAFDGAGNVLVGTRCENGSIIYKLDVSGKPVTSFGSAGAILGSDDFLASAMALAVGPNGDIYAAGPRRADPQACLTDFGVAKFDANGQRVTSFGTNGITNLPVSTYGVFGAEIGIDAQGGIHVGGPTWNCSGRFLTQAGFFVFRVGA
jgi:hypothetical protein